jgi:acyl carrier protein
MSAKEIKLVEIFRVVLDVDDDFDVLSLRRLDEPRWDSLAHISLVVGIEAEFGIKFSISDINQINSFRAALLLVEAKAV